jgi:hypothetical protein
VNHPVKSIVHLANPDRATDVIGDTEMTADVAMRRRLRIDIVNMNFEHL